MLIQIAQFLLGLSILIVLHELGHFIPAKLFKTRVEKFYLFFDYKFSILKKKIGGTTYGIGWIPLGGYVKISGMVDESMDTEGLMKDPEPWEFRAKPAWQRLVILTGGVIVNFILAFVIYAGMMSYYGESYIENSNLKYGVTFGEGLKQIGLENGDKIISVGGHPTARFTDLTKDIIVGLGEEIVVDRNGEILTFVISNKSIGEVIKAEEIPLFPRIPFVVGGVIDTMGAATAGIQPGDSLVGINGAPALFFDTFTSKLQEYKGDTVRMAYYRDGRVLSSDVLIDENGKAGMFVERDLSRYFPITDTVYTGAAAINAGWNKAVSQLSYYVRQFKVIFSPETGAVNQLGGFKTMMQQYEENAWNWQRFWSVTAFISIMLGFLNILPIPALDGGHVVFTLVEMVTGKKPNLKVLEYAQMIGFVLLLGLLIFANGNDFGLWDAFK